MKKILLCLCILSTMVPALPGSAADLSMPVSRSLLEPSASVTELTGTPPAPQMKLAAIGDNRLIVTGSLRDSGNRPPDKPAREELPSTPVALACLALVICILVGRRNAGQPTD